MLLCTELRMMVGLLIVLQAVAEDYSFCEIEDPPVELNPMLTLVLICHRISAKAQKFGLGDIEILYTFSPPVAKHSS